MKGKISCVPWHKVSYHLLHLQWLAGGQILSAHPENLWVGNWVLHLTWWVPLDGVPWDCDTTFAAPSTSAPAWRQGRHAKGQGQSPCVCVVCLQLKAGSSTWILLRVLSGDVQEGTSCRNWGRNLSTVQHSGHFTVLETHTSTWGMELLCSLCLSEKLMHPNMLTARILNCPHLWQNVSQTALVCFSNQAAARAFLESVHTKPRQWEACSKGIRGDLCLISLRGLISKIISHTEQKELPNDLWVSQLLPILGDVAENWLRLLIQKSSSGGSWGHTDTQLARGKHRPYLSHRVAEQQALKSWWPD